MDKFTSEKLMENKSINNNSIENNSLESYNSGKTVTGGIETLIDNCGRLADAGKIIESIRAAKYSEGLKCDHCSSSEVIKYGKYKNIQRYKCKCCGKTFLKD